MTDVQGLLQILDGGANPRSMLVGQDPLGQLAYQMILRVDGLMVGEATPLPTTDAVVQAALATIVSHTAGLATQATLSDVSNFTAGSSQAAGTTTDAPWTTGAGTLVGIAKAMAQYLAVGPTGSVQASILSALLAIESSASASATAANQITGNSTLDSMLTALSAIETSAAASATAANQTTGNTSLSSILTTLAGTLAVSPVAVTPAASTVLESAHVLKASACKVSRVQVNSTTTGGWAVLLDAAAVPSPGALTGAKAWWQLQPYQTVSETYATPLAMSIGAVLLFSTSSDPLTFASSTTAVFAGDAA